MCSALPDKVPPLGINADQLSIMRKNRDDTKEYLTMRENQSHPDMKVPTITGTNFEEFDLAFTAIVRRQNTLIGIPLDYIFRLYAVVNYNAALNNSKEKINFCANLQDQDLNDDT